ncbi:MAG: hypothetical protein WBC73_00285, partial [Phormidesmis sp.]
MSKQKSASQKSSHHAPTPIENQAPEKHSQNLQPEPETSSKAQPIEPLILWVSGGKGGVGKTTTARILTDLLLDKTDYIYGYDCDPINPQFKRFYSAEFLPLTSPDIKTADLALETLAERIEHKAHEYL